MAITKKSIVNSSDSKKNASKKSSPSAKAPVSAEKLATASRQRF